MEPGEGEDVGHACHAKRLLVLVGEPAPCTEEERGEEVRRPRGEGSVESRDEILPDTRCPPGGPWSACGEDLEFGCPEQAMNPAPGEARAPRLRLRRRPLPNQPHPIPWADARGLGCVREEPHRERIQSEGERHVLRAGLGDIEDAARDLFQIRKLELKVGRERLRDREGEAHRERGDPQRHHRPAPPCEEERRSRRGQGKGPGVEEVTEGNPESEGYPKPRKESPSHWPSPPWGV